MLGHLKPRLCHLGAESKSHYQHLYCSICYSLRAQFGLPSSLLINHEMTLSLAAFAHLNSIETEERACPASLFTMKKSVLRDLSIDKAAQLCMILAWLKLVDRETDRPLFYVKQLRQMIEKRIEPILNRLSGAMRTLIDEYLRLIRSETVDFQETTKMSGVLAKQVFEELGQDASQHLVAAGSCISGMLGELITIADALLDLPEDIENREYNPIVCAAEKNRTTIAIEYTNLKKDFDRIVDSIRNTLIETNLADINPVYTEILQQALLQLAQNIQRANGIATRRQDDNRRAKTNVCLESCDCCDPCDCCRCFNTGDCCSCSSESGGCCDSCSCDCG